jgi:hypothetical protein
MANQAAITLASALAGFGLDEPQDQRQADVMLSRFEGLTARSPACTKLKAVLSLLGDRICALTEADLAAQLSC